VPHSEVTEQQIVKFLWQNIVCRFGLPHTIISDNGTNFASKQVASFYDKYKITHRFSSPYYSQGNDQAKISNRAILNNLYKILGKAKGKCIEKLLGVLWAYRTNKRVPTSENPFSLAYKTEAIIPVDISMLALRVKGVVQDQNDALLYLMLDHSKGRRQQAQIRIATYQQ